MAQELGLCIFKRLIFLFGSYLCLTCIFLNSHLPFVQEGTLLIPFRPTVSVQLDNFIPLRNRPDSIGRHIWGRTLPVPCLYRNLPGLTIVGFDVFDGFTGHMKLCVYKLSPAQCKLGKQVPVAKQAMWKGVRLQQWKFS